METRLEEHLPYISIETLLSAATLEGKDRNKIHEDLRTLCFESIKLKKETGQAPNLLEEMLKKLNLSKKDLFHQLKAKNLTGRAYNQVLEFLKFEVEPILKKHLTLDVTMPSIEI